LIDVLCF